LLCALEKSFPDTGLYYRIRNGYRFNKSEVAQCRATAFFV